MKKLMILACVSACVVAEAVFASTVAQGVPAANSANKVTDAKHPVVRTRKMTPEMKKKMLERIGDVIVKPNSQQGKIAFIDTQGEMNQAVFEELVRNQSKELKLNIVYEKSEKGEPAALKAASKANVAVIIVADDTTPTLLAAFEDGWAVVNVRKISAGLTTEEAKKKFLAGRCQREVLKAFALVAGGVYSRYPDNIIAARKISDLDLCKTFIPADTKNSMLRTLAMCGVTPVMSACYLKACQEGWAPAPTNDIQKAIWDKVHQLPTKPIKILPETKPVKE